MEQQINYDCMYKNQIKTYKTIIDSPVNTQALIRQVDNRIYDMVTLKHGDGAYLLLTDIELYDAFQNDIWDIVHCEIKDTIDGIVQDRR